MNLALTDISGVERDWLNAIEEFCGSGDPGTPEWNPGSMHYNKPRTVLFYRAQLRLLRDWAGDRSIRLTDFRRRHMTAYIQVRRLSPSRQEGETLSPTTLHHDCVCAKGFFKFCHQSGMLDADPLAGYRSEPVRKRKLSAPDQDTLRRLLDAIRDYYSLDANRKSMRWVKSDKRVICARRMRAIVMVCVDTAARINEVLNLTIGDIRIKRDPRGAFVSGSILFRITKSGDEREVPIGPAVAASIADYQKVRPRQAGNASNDALFVDAYGNATGYRNLLKSLTAIMKFGDIEHFSFHSFRRYALSCLAHHDFLDAVAIAGHKDPKTTAIYLHTTLEHMQESHRKAAPADSLFTSADMAAKASKPRRLY
jgi:integrase